MLTRCIAFATESAEDRYETMTSTSAFADRDEERNANPAGWPATEAPVASERRRWPPPLKASRGAFVPEKNRARRHRTRAYTCPRQHPSGTPRTWPGVSGSGAQPREIFLRF